MRKNDSKIILFFLYIILVALIGFIAYFGIYVYKNEQNEFSKPMQEIALTDEKIGVIETFSSPEENIEQQETIITIKPPVNTTTENEDTTIESEESTSEGFYYNNLETYSKKIYTSLKSQKQEMKSGVNEIDLSIDIRNILDAENGEENLKGIYTIAVNAFEYDNPDIFYIDTSKLLLFYESDNLGNYRNYIKNSDESLNYLEKSFNNEEDISKAEGKIKIIVSQIKNDIEYLNLDTDYQKIKYVHDWIVNNAEYDQTLSKENKNNIYGTLVEKQATCGGYAKTFKYLMDELGINCIIIQGKATDNGTTEYHAWNYVQIDGVWYGIDCTWDDPILIGENINLENKEPYYTYFLKGIEVFSQSHEPFDTFFGTNIKTNYPNLSISDY